jgi:hypothetical protein
VIRALHAMHLQTVCDSEHMAQDAGRSSARLLLCRMHMHTIVRSLFRVSLAQGASSGNDGCSTFQSAAGALRMPQVSFSEGEYASNASICSALSAIARMCMYMTFDLSFRSPLLAGRLLWGSWR